MAKRGITYIKGEEPNFLKKFKEQVTLAGERIDGVQRHGLLMTIACSGLQILVANQRPGLLMTVSCSGLAIPLAAE